jgi:outer membrane protein OmpA-like peptidoglycan-associated protein
MPTTLSEVEERTVQEKSLADGPSNPMAQHAYEGFGNKRRWSGSGSGLFLGAAAIGLVLVLASVFGVWLLRSVRRLNRQVAHLNRQTEQLDRRVQAAEQKATGSAQQASQAAADAQAAALQRDQVRGSQGIEAGQTQSAPEAAVVAEENANKAELKPKAAQKDVNQGLPKSAAHQNQRDEELQKLQRSMGQIAETHRTPTGLVITLGEKSIRFDTGKSDIAPQYRAVLSRIAGVLKTVKGYSIYVYGYTDDNGTKDYNLTLSTRRARSVRDGLVKAGIDPSLITTKGFGKAQPLVRGNNSKARAANRRVEIGIVDSTSVSARSAAVSKAGINR